MTNLVNNNNSLFDTSVFEIDEAKGMVNLTRIAKAFDKRIDAWKALQATKEFITAFTVAKT